MAAKKPSETPMLIDRVPPHDLEAEKSVLGACLLSQQACDEVSQILRPDDFFRGAHQSIYANIKEMRSNGSQVDVVTLSGYMDTDALERAGGRLYLLDIVNSCPLAGNAKEYATIVKNFSKLRRCVSIGVNMQANAYNATASDAETVISRAMGEVVGLAVASTSNAISVSTISEDLVKQLLGGPQTYIAPPLLPTVHIKMKELVIVAAGTSVGKTAVSLGWADEWSKQHKVCYFEYEMSEVSLVSRLIAKYSQISLEQMDNGLDDDQLAKVAEAAGTVGDRNLYVENVYCDIDGLIAKIHRQAQLGCKVVFIDHLGLIPFDIPNGMNHAKALGSQVTNKLKRTAAQLDIVIVLLCQLNRAAGARTGQHPYPILSDLRDSGEIEQDGDKVIMLWREPSMESDRAGWIRRREGLGIQNPDTEDRTLMHFGIEKYRNGPAQWGKMIAFDSEFMSFAEIFEPVVMNTAATTAEPTNVQEAIFG